ncbi:MAG: GLPGLI family protein [Bacteroidaceae bacterium]|nr:GLPGLI family protein [Bacteroidaceae bacterium]
MNRASIFLLLCLFPFMGMAQEYQTITFGGQAIRVEIIEVEGKKIPVGDMGAVGNRIFEKEKETIVDHAKVECIYSYSIYDPEVDKHRNDLYYMLLSGNNYSWYRRYHNYQIDSLLSHRDMSKVTNKYYEAVSRYFGEGDMGDPEENLKNQKTGEIETYDFFAGSSYVCTEPRIDFGWTLSDDTLTICGHSCHKATCSFRGRDWIAWYADDIMLSDGPWKFGGLPGLILKIQDSKQEHVFVASVLRNGRPESTIVKKERAYAFGAKREWMLKAKRNAKENPAAALKAAGMIPKNLDGTDVEFPRKRLYVFNPIEKE